MKSLKKFFLTMAVAMVFSTSAFAASGFEFLLNLSGGLGATIPNKEVKNLAPDAKGGISADAGIDVQLGYMLQVQNRFGISLLAELGYNFDIYNWGENKGTESYSSGVSSTPGGSSSTERTAEKGWKYTAYYHSFRVGLLPKFNIGLGGRHGLAIGIGGGVKIPISGYYDLTSFTSFDANGEAQYTGIDSQKLKRQEINDMLTPPVIGYMKVTFDYYLFFTDNIAMNFGFYLGGDFGMKVKDGFGTETGASFAKIGNDAFDFGLQLGFRFGPKA